MSQWQCTASVSELAVCLFTSLVPGQDTAIITQLQNKTMSPDNSSSRKDSVFLGGEKNIKHIKIKANTQELLPHWIRLRHQSSSVWCVYTRWVEDYVHFNWFIFSLRSAKPWPSLWLCTDSKDLLIQQRGLDWQTQKICAVSPSHFSWMSPLSSHYLSAVIWTLSMGEGPDHWSLLTVNQPRRDAQSCPRSRRCPCGSFYSDGNWLVPNPTV